MQGGAVDVGIPVGVKCILKGPHMHTFLSVLAEAVLPRVKDFEGIHFSHNIKSGQISFGFTRETMSLFPQIESTSRLVVRLIQRTMTRIVICRGFMLPLILPRGVPLTRGCCSLGMGYRLRRGRDMCRRSRWEDMLRFGR
jgi:ribosomal L5P family C-terminus